jgi:hypothetical protein
MQRFPDLSGTSHLQPVGNFLSLALAGQGFWKKHYPEGRLVEIFFKTSRRKIGIDSGLGLARVWPVGFNLAEVV